MKKNKVINYIFIFIFISTLYAPSVSYFFIKDYIKNDNMENRTLAIKPELTAKNITQFPKLWDDYYNDNLPYRNYIVNNWRNLHYKLFNESLDKRVIIGKNEKNETWLFYDNMSDRDELSFIDGRKNISYTDLDYTVQKINQETNKLKEMNIDIYYIIGPNKSTIYSNYLPKQISVKTDYFLKAYNYLKSKGIDNLFYSLDILTEANKKRETYYRTDTHWNDYGSYLYIKELIKKIYNKDILECSEISEKYINSTGKDLHNFTGLSLKILDNDTEIIYSNNNIEEENIEEEYGKFTIYENKDYKIDETILLIGDSFTKATKKHLCSIYKKVIYLQLNESEYSENILKQYNPSKIFYIRVERSTTSSLNFEFRK